MKNKIPLLIIITVCMVFLLTVAVFAEEARDISSECRFSSDSHATKVTRLTNGDFSKYWQSGERKGPYLSMKAEEPIYGLYLCFREMPESYVLQRKEGDEWVTFTEGDTRFYHVFYELNGETEIRILSTQEKKHRLSFNEVYVFGDGEIPGWVQRWEETEEKADLLLLVAHPDDELLFFAGTIPTYDVEKGKRVVVAYLTYCDKSRRSEALNGLWAMGVRNYPVFGPFTDKYSTTLKDAYKKIGNGVNGGKEKVLTWVTELFRKYKPEVVLTQDIQGEYGHGQHKVVADACIQCYDLAGNADHCPESAELYGTWDVKKLYIHRYGDKADRLRFDWNTPLGSFGGKTGMELASEAFAQHASQAKLYFRIGGYKKPLSVEVTGVYYENSDFGLYASRVGEDEAKNDFLEHVE